MTATSASHINHAADGRRLRAMIRTTVMALACLVSLVSAMCAHAANPRHMAPMQPLSEPDSISDNTLPDRIPVGAPVPDGSEVVEQEIRLDDGRLIATPVDTLSIASFDNADMTPVADTITTVAATDTVAAPRDEWVRRTVEFNPEPTRAVWLSALFPGLGQIYNRRYWKLPLIVGGYLGLAYATDWNNRMLADYTRAYADLTDNDPTTNSYMDFFPSTTQESSLNKTWLENTFRSRKNYFRRNRDLCIISMVGVYLLAMVDAYVDAALSHFDITPDLTMDIYPSLIPDGRNTLPSVGLLWAINF